MASIVQQSSELLDGINNLAKDGTVSAGEALIAAHLATITTMLALQAESTAALVDAINKRS